MNVRVSHCMHKSNKLATTMFLDKAAILFSISISRKLSKNVYDHTGCSNMD